MIHAIFYARFLSEKGVTIINQSPPGILSSLENTQTSSLDLQTLAEYIIPKKAFRNRYLTVLDPSSKYSILGYPVSIENRKYERNEFIFNIGLVLGREVEKRPYAAVVRRLADTFREMEVQNQYLSERRWEEGGAKPIGGVLEIIREDLNNYNECMIPVDSATTINLKLFPPRRPPPAIKSWQVPITTLDLTTIMDSKWDLTMRAIIPQIDGVRPVRDIAAAADVALDLTKLALQHLCYYDALILVDQFLFSNVYMTAPGIASFIANKGGILDDCARYVFQGANKIANWWLVKLFTLFEPGVSVAEWVLQADDMGIDVLRILDVRRFCQFGVIHGILRRQHKYVVSKAVLAGKAAQIKQKKADRKAKGGEVAAGSASSAEDADGGKTESSDESGSVDLERYLDGCHSFNQISVELRMTEPEIMEALGRFSAKDLDVLYR